VQERLVNHGLEEAIVSIGHVFQV